MKLVVENSLYSMFIYMLLLDDWDDAILILDKGAYSKNYKKIVKKVYFYQDLSLKKFFFKYYFEKIKLIYFLFKNKILFNKNYKIYGDELMLSYFFIDREMYLIEDGTWSYQIKEKENFLKKMLRLENPRYLPNGEFSGIKKIFLTGIAPIPQNIEDKVEIIDLKKLWSKKTLEDKGKILSIFDLTYEDLKKIQNKKNILLTQPLSEDGTLSEFEKIEIYKKILKNYNEKEVVIKRHPREKTNYRSIFPKAEIVEQNFPAELFKVLNINFEKAITIFSTAACTLSDETQVDFYGTEIHPKLVKKFGSMREIYMTTACVKK